MSQALVLHGLTPGQRKAQLQWATKRTRYGDTGLSPTTRAKRSAAQKALLKKKHHHRAKRSCPSKHPLIGINLYVSKQGHRYCRTCMRAHNRASRRRRLGLDPTRPVWALTKDNVRMNVAVHDANYLDKHAQLRARVLKSHPDKGGSSNAFTEHMARFKRFVENEARWYGLVGLTAPITRG